MPLQPELLEEAKQQFSVRFGGMHSNHIRIDGPGANFTYIRLSVATFNDLANLSRLIQKFLIEHSDA